MKKLIRIGMMMVMLAVATTISAVPAKRGAVKVQQPDGSEITIMLHGDEWLHFNTTADGYSVVKNNDGFYVYAEKQDGQLKATTLVAHDAEQRQATELAYLAGIQKYLRPEMTAQAAKMKQETEAREADKRAAHMNAGNNRRAAQYDYNNFRGLVILIEYNDKSFSRSDYKNIMNDMINKENYTGFGGNVYTGSVRDYFSDNSLGKFKPEFDVRGPYKVDYSQYYPESTNNVYPILMDAINKADADGVDFSKYDGDNNGQVDLVYFIVAGYGANYGGNDQRLWWPHRSQLWAYKDGVYISDYASSVEMYGWSPNGAIDGIGTICHEFSHVLGLPDFYDTNYSNDGKPQANHPGIWSVMAGGSYENYGRTPVGYSLYERWSVGFCDDPQEVTFGDYTLNPLYQNAEGYKIKTPKNKEYFLLENRQKNQFKWDTYLPASGMLVHRVEGEGNSYWQNNQVNANPDHMYYEVVRANGDDAKNQYDVFPSSGTYLKTELSNGSSPATLKTWDGTNNEYALSQIKMQSGIISFKVSGYEVESMAIDPAVIEELGVGVTMQLTAVVTPSYAPTSLTWNSDNEQIATVDDNGVVKGISPGTCTITVNSDNLQQGYCQVTVKALQPYSIAEFKQEPVGVNRLLQLTNAEVLFAYTKNDTKTVYLRDATGCIMLTKANLDIKTNDIVSGTVYMQTGLTNSIYQAVGVEGTNDENLTISEGPGAQPREVNIDDLSEADYCDLIVVKATKIERNSGLWAYGDNNRARIWAGNFGIPAGVPSGNLSSLYFDVTGVYATDIVSGNVVNEINVTKAVEKVDGPTGIKSIANSQQLKANSQVYNLQGQRVSNSYKGLVIVNGKKVIKK